MKRAIKRTKRVLARRKPARESAIRSDERRRWARMLTSAAMRVERDELRAALGRLARILRMSERALVIAGLQVIAEEEIAKLKGRTS